VIDDSVRTFLQKSLLARMSVLDAKGYPHTVPVWFMLDGDDVVIISVRDTRKVKYIAANPKGSVQVGGDSGDGGGYLLKGDFTIEEDPDDVWMKKLIYRYEESPQAEKDVESWTDLDIIVIRLKVKAVAKV
jgi:general stress protein 26